MDIRALSRAYCKDISGTILADQKLLSLPKFKPDEYQLKVLESRKRFLRVVAPAGSGKTETLMAKAIEVLNQNRTSRVLCLTFTNAAAAEFGKKVAKAEGDVSNRIHVSTVNSFGLDIIGSVLPTSIGPKYPIFKAIVFGTIKAAMQKSELWGFEENKDFYEPIFELSEMTKAFGFSHRDDKSAASSHLKNFVRGVGLSHMLESQMEMCGFVETDFEREFVEEWFPFWQSLTRSLWDKNIVSFEDQKYWALDAIQTEPKALKHLKKKKLSHIFIDEFQDINILDLYFTQLVALALKANLVIVGDDDQTLYEWRGCTAKFIRYPNEVFAGILDGDTFETIELVKNYRCPKNIVSHSTALISNNRERIEKQPIPNRTDDANIRVVPMPAAYMTMTVVNDVVSELAKSHPNHSVAIIGRKKSQLIAMQILMTKSKVNFRVDSDLDLFAGKAFTALRKFLTLPLVYRKKRSPKTNVDDFMAILEKTFRTALSKKDRHGIQEWLENSPSRTLEEVRIRFSEYPQEVRSGHATASDGASRLRYFFESDTVSKCLLIASEVFKGFKKDFGKAKDEIFYVEPPFTHLADLSVNYGKDFIGFLTDIDNARERAKFNDARNAKIELMTALRAKGRQFGTVIILDANDTIFPNKLSVAAGRIEEERRLFYVAITRAMNNLLIFDSNRINGTSLKPSPFIAEMKLPKSARLVNPKLDKISQSLLRELKL